MKYFSVSIVVFLMYVCTLQSASIQDDIKTKTKELEQLDKDLQKSQLKSQELTLKEGKMLEELSSIATRINDLHVEKARRERELTAVEKELQELTGKASDLGKEKEELRTFMEHIIVSSFKHQKKRGFESFMPDTAMQSSREQPLMQEIGSYNYYLIMRTGKVLDEVNTIVTKTQEKKDQVQLAYLNSKIAERKLTSLQKTQNAALDKIRTQKTQHIRLAQELEKRKESMNDLIKILQKKIEEERLKAEKQPKTADKKDPTHTTQIITPQYGTFDKQKKKLSWPVQGTIYAPFGRIVNQRYNTVTHNDGIDILAKSFASVVAVAQGTVVFAQMHKNINTVIIDHGNSYFTIYTNLASMAVSAGTPVLAGTKIGNVGMDVVTGLPILHFEVRSGTQALPPQEWLR